MEPKYCAAPWRGLHINFRGDVKTCCAGDPNMLGDLNHSTMQEILQGTKLREIRETIKSGQLHPEYCINCMKAERYGRSERHWHNDVNPDFDARIAALDDHLPSIVDVRWNITCNLACNYCGPYCSSKWAAIMRFEYRSGARPYHEQVCDYLAQNQQHVREVALVGGEPLLLPENERVLDVIPADCIVTLITNMNVDLERNKIFQRLSERTRVGWSMSFDNIGERFEYVRYHGNWNLLQTNVAQVQDLMRDQGHWGGIHAVYNLYNCTRLCELREWADRQGLKILWQTLYQPEHLDPALHGSAVRLLAVDEILRLRERFKLTPDEDQFFAAVDQRFQQATDNSQDRAFRQHIADTESKYHQVDDHRRFTALWPELAFMLD